MSGQPPQSSQPPEGGDSPPAMGLHAAAIPPSTPTSKMNALYDGLFTKGSDPNVNANNANTNANVNTNAIAGGVANSTTEQNDGEAGSSVSDSKVNSGVEDSGQRYLFFMKLYFSVFR